MVLEFGKGDLTNSDGITEDKLILRNNVPLCRNNSESGNTWL